jgi:hypothetical protein
MFSAFVCLSSHSLFVSLFKPKKKTFFLLVAEAVLFKIDFHLSPKYIKSLFYKLNSFRYVCHIQLFVLHFDCIMAAIIARITKEKRLRDLRLSKEINCSKSNYILEAFPKNFNPELHNKETDCDLLK